MYLKLKSIGVQDPFSINELNGVTFQISKKITRINIEKYEEINNKVEMINKDFNEIRQILYDYVLTRVAEIQQEINNAEEEVST